MSRSRAARTGLSSVFRQPELYLAELMWRWSFYVAAWMVGIYALLGFLDTLPVSDAALFGLYNFIPGSAARAWAEIFRGSGPRLLIISTVAVVGMAMLWWLASSCGRAATLRALIPSPRSRNGTVFSTNALRVLLGILAVLAYAGAVTLALTYSRTRPDAHDPDKFYLILLPLLIVVGTIWSSLSWYLSLVPLLALRTGRSTWTSLGDAAEFSRRHGTQFLWVGFAYGALRVIATIVGTFLFFTMLSFALQTPPAVALVIMLIWAAAFSALGAFVHIAKLAAQVRIVEWGQDPQAAR